MDLLLGVWVVLCASILASEGFLLDIPFGGYDGYSNQKTCRDLNCGAHGFCHEADHILTHAASCICHVGWQGNECDQKTLCGGVDCVHGVCQSSGSWFLTSDTCSCYTGYTGSQCDQAIMQPALAKSTTTTTVPPTTARKTTTTTSTMAPPPQTSTTPAPPVTTTGSVSVTPSATSAKPAHHYSCHTLAIINDLANNVTSTDVNAATCPTSGVAAGSEAFVLHHCNVGAPSTWTRGQKVMSVCSALSPYTPIATFTNGRFDPKADTAGLFLGCLGDQIRIGLQTCEGGTRIEHFSVAGAGFRDANLYYTIQ